MRQMSVISEHPIFIGFRRLTSCQRDPRDRGVTGRETIAKREISRNRKIDKKRNNFKRKEPNVENV